LDGKRPSLNSPVGPSTPTTAGKVITRVWTDGQQGEYNDYFADHCDGVNVMLAFHTSSKTTYLTGFTTAEKNLLKKCLGSSDFDTSNNVEIYNWDYGSKAYPHIIKLVRTVTTYTDGGYYAVIYYDPTNAATGGTVYDNTNQAGLFVLLNPFYDPESSPNPSTAETDLYDIYTTQGTLALTSNLSQAVFGFGSQYIYTVNSTYDTAAATGRTQWRANTSVGFYDGDISCEVGINNLYKMQYIAHCLNKTDIFTVLNFELPNQNPPHINLYTAERLYTTKFTHTVAQMQQNFLKQGAATRPWEGHAYTHFITTDLSTNWGASISNAAIYHVYKFFPATASTYNYVAECSNRGLCDRDTGVCNCFGGYTSDDCSQQSSLSA